AAPEGTQVAFLQGNGSVTQSMSFAAGTYTLGFSAAQRGNLASDQTFQVLVDGAVVGTFNSVLGTGYTGLITSSFTVAAGNHTIPFQGTTLNGGDNTVFIDQVTINQQQSGLPASGFESPALDLGQFPYDPTGMAWSFAGSAGVTANGSGFTAGNPGAPQGGLV